MGSAHRVGLNRLKSSFCASKVKNNNKKKLIYTYFVICLENSNDNNTDDERIRKSETGNLKKE